MHCLSFSGLHQSALAPIQNCKTKTKNSELAPPTGGTFDFKSHATLVIMEFSAHGLRPPNESKIKEILNVWPDIRCFKLKDLRPNVAYKFASTVAPPKKLHRIHQATSSSIRLHHLYWGTNPGSSLGKIILLTSQFHIQNFGTLS